MIKLRPILLVLGILLATLGCAMMVPALYDLGVGNINWQVFGASAVLTLFVGVGLASGQPSVTTVHDRYC